MKILNILIIFVLFLSINLYSQESDTSDLYEQILEYYELARTEYEKGEYIKSYEYSEMANDIIVQLDANIFFKTVDLILNPLKEETSKGLENIKTSSNNTNNLIKDDYAKTLSMHSNAIAYHDEIKEYDAANIDIARSVFNVARNNYESTMIMIEYMNRKLEYYPDLINGQQTTVTTTTNETTTSPTDNEVTITNDDFIANANIMFIYIIKNNIVAMNSKTYKEIKTDINAINNYNKKNDEKKANEIASQSIKEMTDIISKHNNEKLMRYANNGMKKAEKLNKNIGENEDYQNIEKMVDEAKTLYNEKNHEKSMNLLSKSILSLHEDFDIFKKLPKTYTVVRRKNAVKTDSFWNIAGYDFIYADTQLWNILYEENKSKIKYKNNPRIILAGNVFNIPSIIGEEREGHYNAKNMYIPITIYYYLDYDEKNEDIDTNDDIIIETNDDTIVNNQDESGIIVESIGSDDLGKSDTSEQYETNDADNKNYKIIETYTNEDNN